MFENFIIRLVSQYLRTVDVQSGCVDSSLQVAFSTKSFWLNSTDIVLPLIALPFFPFTFMGLVVEDAAQPCNCLFYGQTVLIDHMTD